MCCPPARDDDHPGLCHLPDGEHMYELLARHHTSMTYTPEALHAMGVEIVESVHDEFRDVGSRIWGLTDLAAIFERMVSDPALRYESRDEMLEHARRVVAHAEAEAPKWFGVVPDQACVVEPIPAAEEEGMALAYYMVGAVDGSRPGTYFLNTSKPEERVRNVAEDTAFHEAVPGHHFQLTIALEAEDLVPARRVLSDTACAEGWGLYSERLADEMGLYTDDVARLGLFAADTWRAGRLVVDTGLHAMGWTHAQAIDWLVQRAPMPPDRDRVRGGPLHLVPGSGTRLHGRAARDRPAPPGRDRPARLRLRPQAFPRRGSPCRVAPPPRPRRHGGALGGGGCG